MKLKKKAFHLPFIFFNTNVTADVNSDLNKFFNDMNYSGINYNKGEVWKGQAAGFLAGEDYTHEQALRIFNLFQCQFLVLMLVVEELIYI